MSHNHRDERHAKRPPPGAVGATMARRCLIYGLMIMALIPIGAVHSWRETTWVEIDPAAISTFDGIAFSLQLARPPLSLRSISDSAGNGKSALVLYEDGLPLAAPHSMHADIATRGMGRYSHWGSAPQGNEYVVFAASDSTDPRSNGRRYTASRPLVLSPWITWPVTIVLTTIIITAAFLIRTGLTQDIASCAFIIRRNRDTIAIWMERGAALVLPAIAVGYFVATLVADANGLGPVSTTDHGFAALADAIARSVRAFPSLVIFAGIFAYAASWLAQTSGSVASPRATRPGAPLGVSIALASVFFLTAFKIVHDAGALQSGLLYMSFLGGASYSDASGYGDCMSLLREGHHWSIQCNNRPLASSLRAVTFIFGADNFTAILIQNIGLSAALGIAARILYSHLGLASALVFVGLTLFHAAPFSATLLTETLGIALAVGAVAAIMIAWRTERLLAAAFAAPFLSAIALLVRMGAMFTVVSIAAWSIFSFRNKQPRQMAIAGILAVAALACAFGTGILLSKMYGTGPIGSNFAYTLYGISVGKDWSAALSEIPAAKDHDEAEYTRRVYSAAIANIRQHPGRVAVELLKREGLFFKMYPRHFASGYGFALASWWPLLLICLISGIGFTLARRFSASEIFFVASYLLGVFLSAPIIVADNGKRVIAVSTVYIAFFVAYFLQSPIAMRSSEKPLGGSHSEKRLAIACAGLFAVLLIAPGILPLLHRTLPERGLSLATGANEITIGAELGLEGFVVSENGGRDEAYRHVSIAELGLLTSRLPAVPWSADISGRLDRQGKVAFFTAYVPEYETTGYFLGPAEILTRPDVKFWRAKIAPGVDATGLREIISAEPCKAGK